MKKSDYKKILLDGCYDLAVGETPEQNLCMRFNSEMGHNIKRQGLLKSCKDWLMGLAINIPYNNRDIVLTLGYTEQQIDAMSISKFDRLVERYWQEMAINLSEIVTIEQKLYYKKACI